ncbi:DNA polymerase lambda isoform X2 [Daucus carota subsp. sativus]|uniref:DNA polymerase lambda isoform X2 n=1 Tax=Daucus carota subsp. sativus TaxID=79200 RepID=UPI0007EF3518|nr:PREDICTED: DNA polymerase lambda isoform X2 [Daucus carota subsp. sativus]
MAPKMHRQRKRNQSPPRDPAGIFAGMFVFLIENGVSKLRLQVWKKKLYQMGANVDDKFSTKITHVFANDLDSLLQKLGRLQVSRFKGLILRYQWLEDSLVLGEKASEDSYILPIDKEEKLSRCTVREKSGPVAGESFPKSASAADSIHNEKLRTEKVSTSSEDLKNTSAEEKEKIIQNTVSEASNSSSKSDDLSHYISAEETHSPDSSDVDDKNAGSSESSLVYNPPDLNKNITGIFGKLINIYRAMGDDRRSFSYYKAIPVIEKLPFKIESMEQVKHLPAIGKSMQDHIQEIVTTGKLSKLEHFETDEKVQEMELLLQKAGENVLPGVVILCAGSYRRGKASCGDMDIIITHPDGKSHIGFLSKYIKHLKDLNFLKEDLLVGIHSEEGTDSGVDTYFGLCTYPGGELRHRIDLKVYPKDIYAFGLIQWTGNDVLNRRLRLIAESKGFRLDDKGLFPATKSSGGSRGVRATASLKFKTEYEVFQFLGFPRLKPTERNL